MIAQLLDRKKNKEAAENKTKSAKAKCDKKFLSKIQPIGGVMFYDSFIKKGDGYEACIYIYDYPKNVDEKWMKKLNTMRDVITVVDVSTMDRSETVATINKSMLEQEMRYWQAKPGIEELNAAQKKEELQSLYLQISSLGEVVKLINIRMYVHARTIEELERRVNDVLTELESSGFKGSILLNEQQYEWSALFSPYKEQITYLPKREGKAMPGITLAAALPFHYAELKDPSGAYLGKTFTGGNVIFDIFHKDKKRRYYNAVVVGQMGSGKSTLLKKITLENKIRGNYIRGFDVTGEFAPLVKELGGKIIALDGSQGIINPLQIYRSYISDEDEEKIRSFEDIEQHSFTQHLSRCGIFYRFNSPKADDSEVQEYIRLLRGFYESLGFTKRISNGGVTTLENHAYPTFGELLNYIKNELYFNTEKRILRPELSVSRAERLERIELVIDTIVNIYGHLFNSHTTLDDMLNEQVFFFSVKSLRSLDDAIFNAQMFNAFSLVWDNLIQIGEPQRKSIYQPGFDLDEVKRMLVIMDESHLFINTENEIAVDATTEFAREARKYFGGLILASQDITDFVPSIGNNKVAENIRKLFALTQYKFIMQQDASSQEALAKIFNGQLSDSEIGVIPQLQQGECILSINAVDNILMQVEASNEELMLFQGGL